MRNVVKLIVYVLCLVSVSCSSLMTERQQDEYGNNMLLGSSGSEWAVRTDGTNFFYRGGTASNINLSVSGTLQDAVTAGGVVTNGVVTIDAANARTNTYGGKLIILGERVQSGDTLTEASGEFSYAYGENVQASGRSSHARGYDAIASGELSHASGYIAHSIHFGAWTWQGTEGYTLFDSYESQGPGTFNINPIGGLSGFYIGTTNMQSLLDAKVDVTDGVATNLTVAGTLTGDNRLPIAGTSYGTDSNLVAWWRLDGDAKDSAGSNDGTWVGTEAYDDGIRWQSGTFDDSENAVEESIGAATNYPLTISAWALQTTNQTELAGTIIGVTKLGSTVTHLDVALVSDGTSVIMYRRYSGSSLVVNSTVAATLGAWNHYVIVAAATNDVRLYVNGQLGGTETTSLAYDSGMNILVAGTQRDSTVARNRSFDGQIDEVRLYNRELTTNEITELYERDRDWFKDHVTGDLDVEGDVTTAGDVQADSFTLDGDTITEWPTDYVATTDGVATNLETAGTNFWSSGRVHYLPIDADINAYIASAAVADGDVVELGAGTNTVTASIVIEKSIHLRGQGVGKTVLKTSTPLNALISCSLGRHIAITDASLISTDQGPGLISTVLYGTRFVNLYVEISSPVAFATAIRPPPGMSTHIENVVTYASGSFGAALFIGSGSSAGSVTAHRMRATSIHNYDNDYSAIIVGGTAQPMTLNLHDCNIVSTNIGAGVSHAVDSNSIHPFNIYGGIFDGDGYDLKQSTAPITVHGAVTLANGTTSGTITYAGTTEAGAALTVEGVDVMDAIDAKYDASNPSNYISDVVDIVTTNASFSATTNDLQSAFVVESSGSVTSSLPSHASSPLGASFTFVKTGTGTLAISADSGDRVADSGLGAGIYNNATNETWATITLLRVTTNQWVITGLSGTWTTTE